MSKVRGLFSQPDRCYDVMTEAAAVVLVPGLSLPGGRFLTFQCVLGR